MGVENREGETLIENILMEAMHDILEGDEIDKLLDDCSKRPACIYGNNVDNAIAPSFTHLGTGYVSEQTTYVNQHCKKYEEEL